MSAAIHICQFSKGPFRLGRFTFEDSEMFGPSRILYEGTDRERVEMFPDHSAFWYRYELWVKQGRKLASNGERCIVAVPELPERWACPVKECSARIPRRRGLGWKVMRHYRTAHLMELTKDEAEYLATQNWMPLDTTTEAE